MNKYVLSKKEDKKINKKIYNSEKSSDSKNIYLLM